VGGVDEKTLAGIQERRMLPTKVTQAFQVFIQNRAVDPVMQGVQVDGPPLVVRLLNEFHALRGIPARLIGMGIRPEHVRTPDAYA
jgi:hypothetical protein